VVRKKGIVKKSMVPNVPGRKGKTTKEGGTEKVRIPRKEGGYRALKNHVAGERTFPGIVVGKGEGKVGRGRKKLSTSGTELVIRERSNWEGRGGGPIQPA